MDARLMMREKLLKIPANKWLRLDDREDRDVVTQIIQELIEQRHKFIFNSEMSKFMRLSCDLFEWAAENPGESEIRQKTINGRKYYDLFVNGKLIATK